MDILFNLRKMIRRAPKIPHTVRRVPLPQVDCPLPVSMLTQTVEATTRIGSTDVLVTVSTSGETPPFRDIMTIIWFMLQHATIDTFVVHLLLTPFRKVMPERGVTLGRENVNSGYCIAGEVIVIFREEEWRRTLIHECIHLLDLTTSVERLHFKQAPWVLLPEIHCEVMARFIYCCFLKGDLRDLLHAERAFSIYQMIKVLDHMGMRYEDVLRWDLTKYKAKSQVFAYYIGSAVLFNSFDYLKEVRALRASPRMVQLFESLKGTVRIQDMTALYHHDKASVWHSTLRFTSV